METARTLGVAEVMARTGLGRATIKQAAAAGRIPGAAKLLGTWRFDSAELERWIAANTTSQSVEPERVAGPTAEAPQAGNRQRGGAPSPASNLPPLVVLYPDAPWRGIHDRPAEQSARQTGRRKARTRRTGLSVT